MEPTLRRVAHSLCGRCSASLRRRTVIRHPAKPWTRAPARAVHSSISLDANRRTCVKEPVSSARTFTSSANPKTEAAAPQRPSQPSSPRLGQDDLFHPFSTSPVPEFRRRAAFMKQHAYCPHPDHKPTKLPTVAPKSEGVEQSGGHMAPAHVHFECPDCGFPVYCSKEHWMDHYDKHLEVCDTLRQINEDDHDLRSGRVFHEANLPDLQLDEAAVNMTNWDTFMYTREFEAVNSDRSMRQITRLLTYPITVGSVLHELSPYGIKDGDRLTVEGLKSFSALRYNLHPPKAGRGAGVNQLRPEPPPVRLFILGARAESSLPRAAWVQLAHLFPESRLHLVFIGPESMANRDDEFPLPERTPSNPFGAIVEDRVWYKMKISTIVDYYHTIHKTGHFAPYDPYFDCFVLFHPGLGHPASSHEWEETLPLLLETKVPIISTGYTQFDLERDVEWVQKKSGGEVDVLLEPGENIFRSLRWDLNDMDPQDISCGNWGVWAFRGKSTPRLKHPNTNSNPPATGRRANRAAATDPLSDRVTQALIRRTLCPQQSGDKQRDAQPPIEDLLPPLTSRNDVDLQLYAFLAIILKEFVQSWYGKFTTDEAFVAEILHIVAHCTRALEQRVRKLDLEALVLNEIPEVLDKHIEAYRAAYLSASQPPLEIDPREAYHALWPLPLLSPVPRPEDPATAAEQRDNETAYRQLLVQAVLAILLPTEDLENPCLTALVGEIFSELIIGNVIGNKAAQPWLLFEGICILARVLEEKKVQAAQKIVSSAQPRSLVVPMEKRRAWSAQGFFLSIVQLAFIFLSLIRLLVGMIAMSSSLPPRTAPAEEKARAIPESEPGSRGQSHGAATTAKVPVLEFRAWRCVGNLIELSSRMPWLGGFLSLLQFGATHGPGRIAGLDGTLDRLLSHHIQSLFSASHLSPILRTLRGVLFPNNTPGSTTLFPPSSDAELRALRRRAARCLWGLLPRGVRRVYFGGPLWERRAGGHGAEEESMVDEVEGLLMVLGDDYCNKHFMYSVLELILVRLMPELSDKGVVELWDERLG
ncbi:Putative mRNA processing protein (Mss51) [Tolypocladium paradoxum]|uniref:mRNA processing protein (Mss51) n=1 Tax=Tolypocladium paradoxum TaxID=94208 RepID=A0A2S4L476_9HYPO|nr:Putative mRNA processing protein (Mss51) [Tolypocladium paradoxum]